MSITFKIFCSFAFFGMLATAEFGFSDSHVKSIEMGQVRRWILPIENCSEQVQWPAESNRFLERGMYLCGSAFEFWHENTHERICNATESFDQFDVSWRCLDREPNNK